MPKPAQIASNVLIEGKMFRLKILAMADSDKPHSFDGLYSVHIRKTRLKTALPDPFSLAT